MYVVHLFECIGCAPAFRKKQGQKEKNMKIKKGQKIEIRHIRKGCFYAVALEDFDTKKCSHYPIATLEFVRGYCSVWHRGDKIPCARDDCTLIPQ